MTDKTDTTENQEPLDAAEPEASESPAEPTGEATAEAGDTSDSSSAAAPEPEDEFDIYPLRESGEDPTWAVRIVKVWVGIAIFALIFIHSE